MESIAAGRRRAKSKTFNPKPFVDRIDQLMAKSNVSMRKAGVESGLDHEVYSANKRWGSTRYDLLYFAG